MFSDEIAQCLSEFVLVDTNLNLLVINYLAFYSLRVTVLHVLTKFAKYRYMLVINPFNIFPKSSILRIKYKDKWE